MQKKDIGAIKDRDMTISNAVKSIVQIRKQRWERGGVLVLIPMMFVLLLILMFGFFQARKAYWDHQVKELCAKDGGVTIYTKVNITPQELKEWGGQAAGLHVPYDYENRNEIPFFWRISEKIIRNTEPTLMRVEMELIRRPDNKLLGKIVHYFRRGGDFPSWGHESSFGCPIPEVSIEKLVFVVEGGSK